MTASIQEIARNSTEAAAVAAEAVAAAQETTVAVGRLGESSTEIGNVVRTITSIAEQTNLLALNATIEAARAGDAGRGFAVVAGEVKDLAQETARATEDISRRVAAIQADTEGAVSSIERISNVIAQISDFQATIAAAVEEQTATTDEMSRTVGDVATRGHAISESVDGVAAAAGSTAEGAAATQGSAHELRELAGQLTGVVSQFRY
jgi:methyl-accepting chemotaxis protein